MRVPYVPQMEAAECGAASLAMILAYHGHHAPLSEVRRACGIARDGSTAKNIVVAARTYGLEPSAQKLEPADLADCEGPAILHWEMNHFVVLERWTPAGATIADPAVGRRFVSAEAFDASFTGICIEFETGEEFVLRPRSRIVLGRYLALLEGAGPALAMVLFASLALDALATVVPLTTQVAIDRVLGEHRPDWLAMVGLSAVGLVAFSTLWALLRGSLLLRTRLRLDTAITQQFVRHLLHLPVAFFGQRSLGDLLARVQANRAIRDVLAGQSIAVLADGVMLLAYVALMFAFDAQLSAVVVGAGVLYVVVFLLGRPIVQAGADEALRKDVLAGAALLQILRGITTIKSSGVERTSHRRWINAFIASLNANAKVALRHQGVGTALSALQAAVPVVVLLVGGRRVLDGALTPGRLVAFQMLQAGFLLPLQSVVATLLRLQVVPVLLGRMDDVLCSSPEPERVRKCPRLLGAIELEDVSFRYSPGGPAVLSGVSLRIERGQKVALVGPSGSGKSTLARLLLGLYEPAEGRILLDGNDLAELDLPSVRRQYGVVLQETALFEGTVADNLRLFHPAAPMAHVVQAARVAQIHDDVLALSHGYETRISASGGTLSGGQRQRLALARAIVHRPPVMILDEATSALDAVTEAAIERYLTTRGCTRVVIAHRMSTVRDADVIFVVDGGTIVERGRHDELVEAGGLYARLVADDHRPVEASLPPPERRPVTQEEVAQITAFGDWPVESREELAEHLVRAEHPVGTRVVEQDARATGLYLILEGSVGIELAEPGLAPWTVAELGPGELVGEIGLLDGSPSSASVVARTDVRLLHLPAQRFQELQQRGDTLAARATLTLGGIVAARTRDAVRRYAELRAASGEAPAEPSPARASGARRVLPLAETLLGATLDAGEVGVLERAATSVTVKPGSAVFVEGRAADTLYVLRAGHVALRRDDAGTLAVLAPGALLAETSVFEEGDHLTSAVALDEAVLLAVPREPLVELLLSGQRVARRLLAPITEALVRRFRVANCHLREAVALDRGELDRAHAAREQGLEAAREEREALATGGAGRVPVVTARDDAQSAAACLTALLRAAGRPVSLATVVEAFAGESFEDPAVQLGAVARSLGLACRPLEVPLEELRALDEPIVAVVEGGRAVVVESRGAAGWRLMDPARGRVVLRDDAMRDAFTGVAFEIRDEAATATSASLPQRIARFAAARWPDLARLGAIALVLQGLGMAAALATALAVERVFPLGDRPLLGGIVAAVTAIAVTLVVFSQLEGRAIEHLRAHFDRELLDQLMTHVLRLPIAFFDRHPPGEILQRFQAFENVRQLFSTRGIAALLGGATLLVGGALLLAFSPRLLVLPAAVLLVYALVTWLLFPALRRAAADELKAQGRQQDRLIEMLQGIVTLRMAGDARAAEQRWLPSFVEELAASARQERMLSLAAPLLDGVRGVALAAAVWMGTRAVLEGELGLGALVAFLSVLATFLGAVHGLAVQVLSAAPSLVDYDLVRSTFREPREQDATGLVSPGHLRGRIALDQVSFRYTPDGPLVLDGVSLEIEAGSKVALVGASGSGKSTLGRLLLGLYLPTSGRILFDGKDAAGLDLEALRRRVGVVLQEPFLLAGSIRDNISLGAQGASLNRVQQAAEQAAIHDDVARMAMGYETLVSEGGTTLSGGQRQRIVIARALVSSPAVLLLDEATSALDNLSQAVIERHLARSTATRIVIAHRLSTVVDADRIVVLQKGRVVEQGTHAELVARRGAYFALTEAQM